MLAELGDGVSGGGVWGKNKQTLGGRDDAVDAVE